MKRSLVYAFILAASALLFVSCNTSGKPGQAVSPNNRICVELDAPHPGWIVGIQEVRVDAMNRLHVYAEAKIIQGKENGFSAAVISQTSDCVRVPRDGRETIVYLAGATWNWVPKEIIQVSGISEYHSTLGEMKTKTLFPF